MANVTYLQLENEGRSNGAIENLVESLNRYLLLLTNW